MNLRDLLGLSNLRANSLTLYEAAFPARSPSKQIIGLLFSFHRILS